MKLQSFVRFAISKLPLRPGGASGGAFVGKTASESPLRSQIFTREELAVCDKCSDDRKGKPMVGLEIIRGAKKVDGKDVWEGGKILDPESGRNYTLRLTPVANGSKLEVRGSVMGIGRTQTWVRVQ